MRDRRLPYRRRLPSGSAACRGPAWQLALYRSFGDATVGPSRPADERTLFPLFSNTKVITAAAVWTLVEEGKLRFSDRVAEHVPGSRRMERRTLRSRIF